MLALCWGREGKVRQRGGDVPILVLVLLIDAAHQGGGRRQDLVDEDEDGLLGGQLDALADHVHELANGEVGWHEVLLLIDRRDVRLLDLLADDRDAVRVLLALERGRRVSWRSLWKMGKGDGGGQGRWERLTMRSASALRFSKGCSSLNLDRMVGGSEGRYVRGRKGLYV